MECYINSSYEKLCNLTKKWPRWMRKMMQTKIRKNPSTSKIHPLITVPISPRFTTYETRKEQRNLRHKKKEPAQDSKTERLCHKDINMDGSDNDNQSNKTPMPFPPLKGKLSEYIQRLTEGGASCNSFQKSHRHKYSVVLGRTTTWFETYVSKKTYRTPHLQTSYPCDHPKPNEISRSEQEEEQGISLWKSWGAIPKSKDKVHQTGEVPKASSLGAANKTPAD